MLLTCDIVCWYMILFVDVWYCCFLIRDIIVCSQSAAYAGYEGSTICKEIAVLSSRLLSFNDSPHKHRSLSLQNSSSSDCSFQHHRDSGHGNCSSPPPTATSADRHRPPPLSTEPPTPLDSQHSSLQPKNTNDNSNCGSFHMTLDDYGCQSKYDLNDEGYGTIGMDGSSAGRTRFEFSSPITAGTQSSGAKVSCHFTAGWLILLNSGHQNKIRLFSIWRFISSLNNDRVFHARRFISSLNDNRVFHVRRFISSNRHAVQHMNISRSQVLCCSLYVDIFSRINNDKVFNIWRYS